MTFQQAVTSTPGLAGHCQKGLNALSKSDRHHITCSDTRLLTGSVNIDAALKNACPNDPRWDYGIGVQRGATEAAVWVEVHPAASSSVTDMLHKLQWLKNWLRKKAPNLAAMTQSGFYWVSTNAAIAIRRGSQQEKRLAAAGLRGPVRKLTLP